MNDKLKDLMVTKSLRLLCEGFKEQLADYLYSDERMTDLLQELVSEFVDDNIPIVDEDIRIELAMMMMETLNITAR
jgi:hypothetical protein